MAKRVREDEPAYRPVEAALVRSVATGPKKITEAKVFSFPLPQETSEREPPAPARQGPEPFDQMIRVLMSKSEKAALEGLVNRLAKKADTPLKISHLFRACVLLLRQSEDALLEEARRGARLVRPSNGNPMGIVDFEQRVAQILLSALKNTASL